MELRKTNETLMEQVALLRDPYKVTSIGTVLD